MHSVVALAISDVVAFDLSIPAQVFGHPDAAELYGFTVCGERPGLLPSTTGFDIAVSAGLDALAGADTVVVAGYMPTHDPPAAVSDALREAHRRGARIASVCVGAFALGAAGLLDGRDCTTHWQHAAELGRRFPATRVRPEVLYIDDGDVMTSAGIAAGIDLCLHMVRTDHGAEAAARTSRRMVAALHRPGGQAQYIERPLPDRDSPLARTSAWVLGRLSRPHTVAELAAHAGYSERTFARQFQASYGMSVARWLTAQRVIESRRLLEMTDLSIEEIARSCGFGDGARLRTHFGRALGTTPTAYRSAYRGRPSA
jgi:transcriptional regulator GlxA family with amidase domain